VVFASSHARRVFENATGIELTPHPPLSLHDEVTFRRLGLPGVENFSAAAGGGDVTLRILHTHDPDLGVEREDLRVGEIERGPRAGEKLVTASASRGNVHLMFGRSGDEIDAATRAYWDWLVASLDRL
jgi:hypothetical protein